LVNLKKRAAMMLPVKGPTMKIPACRGEVGSGCIMDRVPARTHVLGAAVAVKGVGQQNAHADGRVKDGARNGTHLRMHAISSSPATAEHEAKPNSYRVNAGEHSEANGEAEEGVVLLRLGGGHLDTAGVRDWEAELKGSEKDGEKDTSENLAVR
jgi:hypothetical protein